MTLRDRLTSRPVEAALDAALAGPLPELVARSLAEHHVVERMADELVRDGDVDRLTEQVVASPVFRRTLVEVLSGPEVREALTRQTTTYSSELLASLRARLSRWDDAVSSPHPPYAGLATRGAALVVDATIVELAWLVGIASLAVVATLVGTPRHGVLADLVAGIGFAVVAITYFAVCWSSTGQTPGMRLLGLRVVADDGRPLSLARALVRTLALGVAIACLLLGFVPVLFDRRRRALQDFVARTAVTGYDKGPAVSARVGDGRM